MCINTATLIDKDLPQGKLLKICIQEDEDGDMCLKFIFEDNTIWVPIGDRVLICINNNAFIYDFFNGAGILFGGEEVKEINLVWEKS
jgi:hypothetical protein